jgi:hypothetical protein
MGSADKTLDLKQLKESLGIKYKYKCLYSLGEQLNTTEAILSVTPTTSTSLQTKDIGQDNSEDENEVWSGMGLILGS